MFRSVDLPQPLGSNDRDERPRRDVEADAIDRRMRPERLTTSWSVSAWGAGAVGMARVPSPRRERTRWCRCWRCRSGAALTFGLDAATNLSISAGEPAGMSPSAESTVCIWRIACRSALRGHPRRFRNHLAHLLRSMVPNPLHASHDGTHEPPSSVAIRAKPSLLGHTGQATGTPRSRTSAGASGCAQIDEESLARLPPLEGGDRAPEQDRGVNASRARVQPRNWPTCRRTRC